MRETKVKTLCIMLGIMLLAGTSFAGALATDTSAYDDGNTVWRGNKDFTLGNLQVTVDYCVYGAGDFSGSYYNAEISSTDTPASNEFTYAYQVFSTGTVEANVFSVNMLNSNEAVGIGYVAGTGDQVVDLAAFDAAAPNRLKAWWDFSIFGGGGLLNDEDSDILVYTSVNAPLWTTGTIQDGGTSAQNDMPSPSDLIPEPTTLVLLAVGGLAAIRRRRR